MSITKIKEVYVPSKHLLASIIKHLLTDCAVNAENYSDRSFDRRAEQNESKQFNEFAIRVSFHKIY